MNASMWHALILILLDFCKRPRDIPSIRFFHNLIGKFLLWVIYIKLGLKKKTKSIWCILVWGKKMEVGE